MKHKQILIVFLGIIFVAFLSTLLKFGKFNNSSSSLIRTPGHKLQVQTSFYPLYFFTSEIGGDRVDVINLTPSGAEPHDYEPTAKEIAAIIDSQILIINGQGLEIWYDKIKDQLTGTKVVATAEGLTTQERETNDQKVADPHVWLSPRLAKKQVQKIADALIAVDPAYQTFYEDNKNRLIRRLDQLIISYKNGLANCRRRDIITSHTAFNHLADEFDLNQFPISGISPDEEPSPQQLATVADFARQNNVKYIFFESLVSPKLSQTIASEIGAQTLVLNPIEGLSKEEFKQGKNYFTIMEDNLRNLRLALQCQ